ALFIAIATNGLAAPEGRLDLSAGLAAALGGILGAILFRRSLWGVLGIGALFFYMTRAITG
ncbi:MAG: hypothetical protein M3N43_03495, partial [Actinomycetota bacterium]|nr:hypothetical protein [Actinomycetota bacterium]